MSTRAHRFSDAFLDKCDAAYRDEYDRWSWRRKPNNSGFELARVVDNQHYPDITNLIKRECKDKHDAESWLNTYRGRAAMKAALVIVADHAMNTFARTKRRDPLRNNPVVGFMSEAQAERILAEMRGERNAGR